MKRLIANTTLTLVLMLAFGAGAYAQNVHLKPPRSTPSFIDGGLVLSASASLAGLSNEDLVILLTAKANATATCTNPAGATQPAGQNPAPVTVSGSEAVPSDQVKNGSLSFSLTTTGPTTPIAGAPGCPNSKWTEDITDLAFTSATITVQQPADTTVLTIACTFSSPTADGTVPSSDVTCTVTP
jgi:hypothetical protein